MSALADLWDERERLREEYEAIQEKRPRGKAAGAAWHKALLAARSAYGDAVARSEAEERRTRVAVWSTRARITVGLGRRDTERAQAAINQAHIGHTTVDRDVRVRYRPEHVEAHRRLAMGSVVEVVIVVFSDGTIEAHGA